MGKKAIPDRWINYDPVGKCIPGTRFIAFKQPLREEISARVEKQKQLSVKDLIDKIPNLGLIIDLTEKRRYDCELFLARQIKHVNIEVPGRQMPHRGLTRRFNTVVLNFLSQNTNNDKLIGVHCTHGVNRTGFMICQFMISELGIEPEKAIESVGLARGYPIERENYVARLYNISYKNDTKPANDALPSMHNLNVSKDRPRMREHNVKKDPPRMREENVPKYPPRIREQSVIQENWRVREPTVNNDHKNDTKTTNDDIRNQHARKNLPSMHNLNVSKDPPRMREQNGKKDPPRMREQNGKKDPPRMREQNGKKDPPRMREENVNQYLTNYPPLVASHYSYQSSGKDETSHFDMFPEHYDIDTHYDIDEHYDIDDYNDEDYRKYQMFSKKDDGGFPWKTVFATAFLAYFAYKYIQYN